MMIDIVLLYYNRPRMVEYMLRSIKAQTDKNWRLHVVDDGSSKSAWPTIKKVFDPETIREKILYYMTGATAEEKGNEGSLLGKTLNDIFAQCQYVLFVNDDDMLYPSCIEIGRDLFSRIEADLLITGATAVNIEQEEGWTTDPRTWRRETTNPPTVVVGDVGCGHMIFNTRLIDSPIFNDRIAPHSMDTMIIDYLRKRPGFILIKTDRALQYKAHWRHCLGQRLGRKDEGAWSGAWDWDAEKKEFVYEE